MASEPRRENTSAASVVPLKKRKLAAHPPSLELQCGDEVQRGDDVQTSNHTDTTADSDNLRSWSQKRPRKKPVVNLSGAHDEVKKSGRRRPYRCSRCKVTYVKSYSANFCCKEAKKNSKDEKKKSKKGTQKKKGKNALAPCEGTQTSAKEMPAANIRPASAVGGVITKDKSTQVETVEYVKVTIQGCEYKRQIPMSGSTCYEELYGLIVDLDASYSHENFVFLYVDGAGEKFQIGDTDFEHFKCDCHEIILMKI